MARDGYNKITLGNRDRIPLDPLNQPWQVLVDKFYTNNPHLLPVLIQLVLSHVQANFSTKFVQINHSAPSRMEEVDSASLLHLAMITEVADKDDLANPNDISEDLKPDHIKCLVEVLQARAKEMRNGQRKADLGKHAPAKPG